MRNKMIWHYSFTKKKKSLKHSLKFQLNIITLSTKHGMPVYQPWEHLSRKNIMLSCSESLVKMFEKSTRLAVSMSKDNITNMPQVK